MYRLLNKSSFISIHPSLPLHTPSHISCATTPSPALLPPPHMSHAYTLLFPYSLHPIYHVPLHPPLPFSLPAICHMPTPFSSPTHSIPYIMCHYTLPRPPPICHMPTPFPLPPTHMSHVYTLPSSFLHPICHTPTPFPPPPSTPYIMYHYTLPSSSLHPICHMPTPFPRLRHSLLIHSPRL